VTTTAAAAGTRRHTGTYAAEPRQVGLARAALAGWLGGCPWADEAILVASEFATNSVLHSASRDGGVFTLRAEVRQDWVRIEVEDGGGPLRDGLRDDGRPHGFDVVAAIAGAGNWGVDGDDRGRVAWAWLGKGEADDHPALSRGCRAAHLLSSGLPGLVRLLGQEARPVARRGRRPRL
jgi:hypothetical protein